MSTINLNSKQHHIQNDYIHNGYCFASATAKRNLRITNIVININALYNILYNNLGASVDVVKDVVFRDQIKR